MRPSSARPAADQQCPDPPECCGAGRTSCSGIRRAGTTTTIRSSFPVAQEAAIVVLPTNAETFGDGLNVLRDVRTAGGCTKVFVSWPAMVSAPRGPDIFKEHTRPQTPLAANTLVIVSPTGSHSEAHDEGLR